MNKLKKTAYGLLRGIDDPSLQPSDLVQNALLKKPDQTWKDERHFLNDTRKKMKQVLLDHLRRKNAVRRQMPGYGEFEQEEHSGPTPSEYYGFVELSRKLHSLQFTLFNRATVPDINKLASEYPEQIEAFLDHLAKLEAVKPEWAETVELRIFAGLTFEQIAEISERSEKTVRNYWLLAKAFLGEEI